MITFRPHTREDVQMRVRWLNNHQAVLYAIDEPNHITTEESQNKWFDTYEEKESIGTKKFFTILSDGKYIGFMGLSNINKKIGNASVFILIGEDGYRGRGIGKQSMDHLIKYAFEDLNLKSLYLEVDKSNLPAIRLYDKLGFKKIGEDGKFFTMTLPKPDVSKIRLIDIAQPALPVPVFQGH
ncbi:MAG: GNAT family protein [bacterium]